MRVKFKGLEYVLKVAKNAINAASLDDKMRP